MFAVYLIHFKFVGIKDMHNIYYLELSGEHRCPLGYLLLYVRCKSGVTFVRRCFNDKPPNKHFASTDKLFRRRECSFIMFLPTNSSGQIL